MPEVERILGNSWKLAFLRRIFVENAAVKMKDGAVEKAVGSPYGPFGRLILLA
jgi:hypothetical protein